MIVYMLIGLWLSWGISYPLIAWSLDAADPITTRIVVMPVTALLLLGFLALAGRRLVPARENWGHMVIAALFNMALFQTLMNIGIMMTGPGKASILVYTMPAWTALWSVVGYGQRLDARTIAAVALGLGAVALVLIGDPSGIERSIAGALVTLAAAASFGFGAVYMKRVEWRDEMLLLCAWQFAIGGVMIIPVALLFREQLYLDLTQVRGVIGLVYIVFIASALAYYLWFTLVRSLPVTVAGITTLVVPCIGVATSALLTDYRINPYDIAALALVLLSISLVTFDRIFRRGAPAVD